MDLQRKIADELDRTPAEILKKLEEIRNKIIWDGSFGEEIGREDLLFSTIFLI